MCIPTHTQRRRRTLPPRMPPGWTAGCSLRSRYGGGISNDKCCDEYERRTLSCSLSRNARRLAAFFTMSHLCHLWLNGAFSVDNVKLFGVNMINGSIAATSFIGKRGFMDGIIRLSLRICLMAPWLNPSIFLLFLCTSHSSSQQRLIPV